MGKMDRIWRILPLALTYLMLTQYHTVHSVRYLNETQRSPLSGNTRMAIDKIGSILLPTHIYLINIRILNFQLDLHHIYRSICMLS